MEKETVEAKADSCEICQQPTDVLNIIPKHKPDGSLITLACTKCSIEAGMFCQEHQIPHLGFDDETTACRKCIDYEVEANASEIAANFTIQIAQSPKHAKIIEAIDDYVLQTAFTTGDSEAKSIARAVVTAAKRFNKSPEEIISETVEIGPQVLFAWED